MYSRPSVLVLMLVPLLPLSSTPARGADADPLVVAAGARLVQLLDCNACHTPKVLTPEGPRWDPSRLLSGHSADRTLPSVPDGVIAPTAWGGLFNHDLTAWVGPWGTSFATNLTPDEMTGIGSWTEEMFARALRTGIHVEEERPFLPPMPTYALLADEELRAMFAYLQSIEPIYNEVPAARPAERQTPAP